MKLSDQYRTIDEAKPVSSLSKCFSLSQRTGKKVAAFIKVGTFRYYWNNIFSC